MPSHFLISSSVFFSTSFPPLAYFSSILAYISVYTYPLLLTTVSGEVHPIALSLFLLKGFQIQRPLYIDPCIIYKTYHLLISMTVSGVNILSPLPHQRRYCPGSLVQCQHQRHYFYVIHLFWWKLQAVLSKILSNLTSRVTQQYFQREKK